METQKTTSPGKSEAKARPVANASERSAKGSRPQDQIDRQIEFRSRGLEQAESSETSKESVPRAESKFRSTDSFKQLASDLVGDLKQLFKRERQLISSELREKTSLVKAAGAYGIAGYIFTFMALQVLTAAGVVALALVMPLWGAFLVAALVLGVLAIGFSLAARHHLSAEELNMEHTKQSINQIKTTVEERVDAYKH